MLPNVSNGVGIQPAGSSLDLATDALARLAYAAMQAEGAFSQLVRRAGAGGLETGAPIDRGISRGSGRPELDSGTTLIEDIVASNEIAADGSMEVWDGFGTQMIGMFQRLFQLVTRDGEVSFAALFNSIAPIVVGLFQQIAGIDFSGILGSVGGIFGTVSGGQGAGLGDILGAGSSLLNLAVGRGGPLGGILSGGGSSIGGIFSGATGAMASAMPYIGAALSVAQILGPMLFAPSPSVGPTTVARVSPARREAIYSTDNDGDPDALIDTVESIFDEIERFQSRFGGILNGNGFDIGYFPNPEDGSGQTGGYNFKAIIGTRAEDEDRFKGLTEAELVTEAVKFIVQEGLDGIDVAEVAEAAKHSVADSLEDLFDDLVFAERFGGLRVALENAGEGIDAYTVALQRQRQEIEETGRALATDGVTAIRDFLDRVLTLFPGEPYLRNDEGSVDTSANRGRPS